MYNKGVNQHFLSLLTDVNVLYIQPPIKHWKEYVVSIICKSYADSMETVRRVIPLMEICGKIKIEIV